MGRSVNDRRNLEESLPSEAYDGPLDDQLDFLVEGGEERTWRDGVSWSVIVSVIVHFCLITWVFFNYHPVTSNDKSAPMAKYVVLMKQNPDQQFTEAPGKKIDKTPLNAPYSDANRKASAPQPTGDQPAKRPGDGSGLYTPSTPRGSDARQPSPSSPAAAQSPAQVAQQQPTANDTTPAQQVPDERFAYRQPAAQASAAATGAIDWRRAAKEVKVCSLGTGQDEAESGGGGEKGFAETGPLSFESQWYPWGDYSASMVSKIRVHWKQNMPPLLYTGMKGIVSIRFKIHRSGAISDITVISSSGIPPYDFAAQKAIEQSSPLNPLPPDFTPDSERVICTFYYNYRDVASAPAR